MDCSANFGIVHEFRPRQRLSRQGRHTYLHLLKSKSGKASYKNGLHLVLPPLKPAVISTQKINLYKPDDKLLNNVQVYPNPVTDEINLKYDLSRSSNVNIKILDVLGNDIITLYSANGRAPAKKPSATP